jgi:glycosyltransferase involved in cell wall biosynthesis
LHLRGTPARGYESKLRGLASQFGVANRLHILPPAAPDDMVRLAAEYDVGLVSETGETHNRRVALSNKQFTYLLAGLPGIMSNNEAHVGFAPNAAGAVDLYGIEDAASLAAALDALLSDPGRLAQARTLAFALGQERFNWEAEAPRLVSMISGVLDATGGVRGKAVRGHVPRQEFAARH